MEDGVQRPHRHVVAAVDRVLGVGAVHQHLRLHDRHDPGLLAERRVARQRMGVGVDAVPARPPVIADGDDRAPFGEARAEAVIVLQPLAQPVEPLGDLLARACRRGPWRRHRP